MTRHEAKPPVTAEQARMYAQWCENNHLIEAAIKLRQLADWLETYDPEQLMEIVARYEAEGLQEHALGCSANVDRECDCVMDKARAALAKWNGGTTDARS